MPSISSVSSIRRTGFKTSGSSVSSPRSRFVNFHQITSSFSRHVCISSLKCTSISVIIWLILNLLSLLRLFRLSQALDAFRSIPSRRMLQPRVSFRVLVLYIMHASSRVSSTGTWEGRNWQLYAWSFPSKCHPVVHPFIHNHRYWCPNHIRVSSFFQRPCHLLHIAKWEMFLSFDFLMREHARTLVWYPAITWCGTLQARRRITRRSASNPCHTSGIRAITGSTRQSGLLPPRHRLFKCTVESNKHFMRKHTRSHHARRTKS